MDFVLVELVALVLLSVIAVAVGGARALPWTTDAERSGGTQRAVTAAAERFVETFLDIDHRRVDQDSKQIQALTTSPFRGQFTVNSTDLRIAVVRAQSVTTGTVRAAGVERADGRSARVLVAADAVVRSRLTKAPKRSHYRFVVSLAKVDGRWLVSQFAEER